MLDKGTQAAKITATLKSLFVKQGPFKSYEKTAAEVRTTRYKHIQDTGYKKLLTSSVPMSAQTPSRSFEITSGFLLLTSFMEMLVFFYLAALSIGPISAQGPCAWLNTKLTGPILNLRGLDSSKLIRVFWNAPVQSFSSWGTFTLVTCVAPL